MMFSSISASDERRSSRSRIEAGIALQPSDRQASSRCRPATRRSPAAAVSPSDHIAGAGDMVEIGSGALREVGEAEHDRENHPNRMIGWYRYHRYHGDVCIFNIHPGYEKTRRDEGYSMRRGDGGPCPGVGRRPGGRRPAGVAWPVDPAPTRPATSAQPSPAQPGTARFGTCVPIVTRERTRHLSSPRPSRRSACAPRVGPGPGAEDEGGRGGGRRVLENCWRILARRAPTLQHWPRASRRSGPARAPGVTSVGIHYHPLYPSTRLT